MVVSKQLYNQIDTSIQDLYFRQKRASVGIDWEDMNKQSYEIYKSNYYV